LADSAPLDVAGATNYGLRFRLRRPANYAG
jgi:hypothetical protein